MDVTKCANGRQDSKMTDNTNLMEFLQNWIRWKQRMDYL